MGGGKGFIIVVDETGVEHRCTRRYLVHNPIPWYLAFGNLVRNAIMYRRSTVGRNQTV